MSRSHRIDIEAPVFAGGLNDAQAAWLTRKLYEAEYDLDTVLGELDAARTEANEYAARCRRLETELAAAKQELATACRELNPLRVLRHEMLDPPIGSPDGACMAYGYDTGLLSDGERAARYAEARKWLQAWCSALGVDNEGDKR